VNVARVRWLVRNGAEAMAKTFPRVRRRHCQLVGKPFCLWPGVVVEVGRPMLTSSGRVSLRWVPG